MAPQQDMDGTHEQLYHDHDEREMNSYTPGANPKASPELTEEVDSGEKRLNELGYKQELNRRITFFGCFGLTFSIVSVLLGPNTLYAIGIANGGPVAVTWGWVLVSIMTLFVVAAMCEIASAYPTAGGMYFWVHHLTPDTHLRWKPLLCWLTGYVNIIGQVAGTSSVFLSAAQLLVVIIMLAGGGANDGGWLATRGETVGIAIGMYVISATYNSLPVIYQNTISRFSILWSVVIGMLIIIALPSIAKEHQSAKFVFGTFINNSFGVKSNVYVFLLGLLLPAYQFSGYDGAFHIAEETQGADWTTPLSLMIAMVSAQILGFIYLTVMTFSIQDYDRLFAPDTETGGLYPVAQIFWDAFTQRFDSGKGSIAFLAFIAVGILITGHVSITSNSRLVYAFSRDGALPGSFLWRSINAKRVPVYAVWGCSVLGMLLMLPYIWSITAFAAFTSIVAIGCNFSYFIPIFIKTYISGNHFTPGPFYLGWFSKINGTIACLWILFMTAIFVMPTAYPVEAETLNYAGVALGSWLLLVLAYWVISGQYWFTGPQQNLAIDII